MYLINLIVNKETYNSNVLLQKLVLLKLRKEIFEDLFHCW